MRALPDSNQYGPLILNYRASYPEIPIMSFSYPQFQRVAERLNIKVTRSTDAYDTLLDIIDKLLDRIEQLERDLAQIKEHE